MAMNTSGMLVYLADNFTNNSSLMMFPNDTVDEGLDGDQYSPRPRSILRMTLWWMNMYYTPSIACLGIAANSVAIAVLLASHLRHISYSHYLASVAVVNSIYLLALLIQWLTFFNIDVHNRPGWCQFMSFTNSMSAFLSVWLVVAFAVDRAIALHWPKSSARLCTPLRAKIVIIGLTLMGFVVYMNISLTVGVLIIRGRPQCTPLGEFYEELRVLTIIDLAINLALPYLGCVVLYVLMVHSVTLSIGDDDTRARSEPLQPHVTTTTASSGGAGGDPNGHVLLTPDSPPDTPQPEAQDSIESDAEDQMRRLSLWFLGVFLITHLPMETLRFAHTARELHDLQYQPTNTEYYCQVLSGHVYNSSLATHLFLLLACHRPFARSFRFGMVRLFARWRRCLLSGRFFKATREGTEISLNRIDSNVTSPSYV